MKASLRPVAVLVASASLVVACSSGDDESADPFGPNRPSPNFELISTLEQFDSCDAVRSWAHDELAPRVGAYGFPGGGIPMEGDVAVEEDTATRSDEATAAPDQATDGGNAGMAPEAPADAAGTDDSAQSGYSETNVQVEGVDEPDVVKADGSRIVSVVDGRLHLVSADTAELLDSVDLPEGMYDGELLMAGDRVLLFSNEAAYRILDDTAVADRILPPDGSGTVVMQVEVVDNTLQVSDNLLLDGTYVSARMVDDVVRLVLHADPQAQLPFVTPAGPSADAEAQAQTVNQQVVADAAAEDFLPKWHRLGEDGSVAEEGTMLDCEDAHAPQTFSGFGMVTVLSIDVSDGVSSGIVGANGAGVMAGGQTVYASAEHLYVAAPAWVDWETMSEDERIAAAEAYGTDIHRFDITDPTSAVYEMSGRVAGSLLNQFAMDEFDGNLRVATTTGSPWAEGAEQSDNHVVVLAPGDGALNQIGAVSELGRGETIHSVRFLGEVGYVVTFRQTDPLYTIDLSDPANPHVTGELHMLGYSAYLHPIGDGKLIGVGQDATESGSQLGTQVALFDVSDPAAPSRLAQATVADGSSTAEFDHHAFLWWAEEGLVALPMSVYSYDERTGVPGAPFDGLIGFTVDVAGATIGERGRIAHPAAQIDPDGEPIPIEPGPGGGSGGTDPAEPIDDVGFGPGEPYPYSYAPPILRSLVIGGKLWTLSSAGLATSDLATFESLGFVPFGS